MAFAALPLALGAQTISQPPRAPTREEVQRPTMPAPLPAPKLIVEGGVERSPCALDAEAYRDIRFTPTDVTFDDLRGLAPEDLRPAFTPYLGREQPISAVCEIRDRAATILRDAGYIAAVEIPEQHISGGKVRFTVLMAKLIAIHVRGDAGRSERTIARYLEKLTRQEVFNRYEAERYLLLASDLPGYQIRLSLRSAGAGRGEVVGDVIVQRVAGEVDANLQNFGSHALGPWGALVRGELYGLTGLGDRTSLAFYSTLDFKEQQTLQLGHDFRVGSEGLILSGQFTYAWTRPTVADPGLHVRARTLLATAEARYPFERTQASAIWGAIGLDIVDQDVSVNTLPLTRDRLRIGFARFDFTRADRMSFGRRAGYSAAEPRWRLGGTVELRQGLGLFGATPACGAAFTRCLGPGLVPPSHVEGDAKATVLRVEGAAEFRPAPVLGLFLGIRAQSTGKPLLSFEEYSAGNYTIGRGYDPATLLGDRGIGFQAELRYGRLIPPGPGTVAIQPFLFFDAAWVNNLDRVFPAIGPQRLASAGGGVRASFGDRARLEITLAAPLERAGLETKRRDPRLLVTLTTRLLPWSAR
ncbi:MAG: putative hemolysin activation/secretion protein [Alphaproteobacteria bacterium]|nr:putative hemolysin activation/secretion protein [Alphaproteobacteria bacterium]